MPDKIARRQRELTTVLKQDLFESRGVQIHNIVTKILAWHKIEIDKLHEYYKDLITQVHNDNKL